MTPFMLKLPDELHEKIKLKAFNSKPRKTMKEFIIEELEKATAT